MIGDLHSRMYRCPALRAGKQHLGRLLLERLGRYAMSGAQQAALAAIALAACCVGMAASGAAHARIAAVEARAQEAQRQYIALDNEHIHLLTTRAQLGSRERIGKIAGTRLQLFEPEKGQVQHM